MQVVTKNLKNPKRRKSQGNPVEKGIRTETQGRDRFLLPLKSDLLSGQRLSLLRFILSHRFKLKPPPVRRVCSSLRINLYQCTASSHLVQQEYVQPSATGPQALHPGSACQNLLVAHPSTSLFSESTLTGAYNVPLEPDTLDIDPPLSDASANYSDDQASSDEGEISSTLLISQNKLKT